jgi:hypothetical protein
MCPRVFVTLGCWPKLAIGLSYDALKVVDLTWSVCLLTLPITPLSMSALIFDAAIFCLLCFCSPVGVAGGVVGFV